MSRLLRNGVAVALCCALGGCASFSLLGQRKTPPTPPAPSIIGFCPGGLRADVQAQPKLPDGAGFPAPLTDEEKAATATYLDWLKGAMAWGRSGWLRAGEAKAYCDKIGG